jgi:hypothetical protein
MNYYFFSSFGFGGLTPGLLTMVLGLFTTVYGLGKLIVCLGYSYLAIARFKLFNLFKEF